MKARTRNIRFGRAAVALVLGALALPAVAQADSDLSLSVTDTPDPVTNGSQLTYGLSVRNDGPDAANGLTVTQSLPADVTFNSASPGCTYSAMPTPSVTCTQAAPLGTGVTTDFSVVVVPTEPVDIASTVVASSGQVDPDLLDNTVVANTHVRRSYDLRLRLIAFTNPAQVGSSLRYELRMFNRGPDGADGAQLSLPVPPGKADFVSASPDCAYDGTAVVCTNPATLGAGFGGVEYEILLRPTAKGQLATTATVSAPPLTNDQQESVTTNNTDSETVQVRQDAVGGLCKGNTVTIADKGKGGGLIRGTPGRDVIDAGKGDDVIKGRGGDDVICGGDGNDKLIGGGGRDKLYGGKGKDVLNGGGGADVCSGGGGSDRTKDCES